MRIVVPLGIEVGGAKLTTPWGEGGGGSGEEALPDVGDFCGLLLSNPHLKCPQWLKERLLKQLFRFFETYPSFADIRGSIAPTPVINGSFDDIILVHGNPLLI